MAQLNLNLTLNSNGSITASWSPVAGAIRYHAYMYQVGKSNAIYNETNLTTTSYTSQADLEANQQYKVTVVAYSSNASLDSEGGQVLIPLEFYNNTPLGVPLNVKATADTVSVTVSFDKVIRATGYDILFDNTVYSVTDTTRQFAGLTPETNHTYAVRAKNAAQTGAYSTTMSIMTLPQSLSVPSNIIKTATENSVTLSWDAVPEATSYDILFNGRVYNVTENTKTFTGLSSNTSYTYQVRSNSADGSSGYSEAKTIKTAPVRPTSFSGTSTKDSVTISWNAVSGAESYDVLIDGKTYRVNGTSTTITGLKPGTSYTYQVRSNNADGSSTYGAVNTIATMADLAVPTDISATATSSSITISWSAVPGATGYDVRFNGNVYNVTETSMAFTGMSYNVSCTYSVRAKNESGVGEYSETRTIKTLPKPPAMPTNAKASATSYTVTVSWTAVTGATSYEVRLGGNTYTATEASITITDLLPSTTYSYQIRAKNEGGTSMYTSVLYVRTLSAPPDVPTGITATATTNTITVSWNTVTNATGYYVLLNGGFSYYSNKSPKAITGCTPGTEYTYAVCATNGGGNSAYSPEQTIRTIPLAPGAPTGVKATSTADSVTVEWEAVTGADTYEIIFGGTTYETSDTAYTVTGLTADTQYSYKVRAKNEGGTSVYTAVYTVKTLLELEVPSDVRATAKMNSVTVSWNPVSGAASYDVEFDGTPYHVTGNETAAAEGVVRAAAVRAVPGAQRICKTFYGLKANTEHSYAARANNAERSSAYSERQYVTTEISRQSGMANGRTNGTYPDGKMSYTGNDPVNALTGAFLWSYTWLQDYGKDGLHFTTMYDSGRSEFSKVLGRKWTHSFLYFLSMDEDYAYFGTPYDDVTPFRRMEDGSFPLAEGISSAYSMEKKEDGSYAVKNLDGTEYIFDGNLCLFQILEGGFAAYQFETNETGEVVRMESRHGATLHFAYTDGYLTQAMDAMGNTVTFTYEDGKMVSVINPAGKEMFFTYDDAARLLTISDFTGNVYLTNHYDERGRVTEQDTAGRGKSFASYDEENRVTTFTDELGNDTRYAYDEAGHITDVELAGSRIHNTYNENGQLTEQVDALGNVTRMEYDECGRMNRVIHPDGTEEQVFYNDRNLPQKMVNRDGTNSQYGYDARNNLRMASDERSLVSVYTYDSNDNLISYRDTMWKVWNYTYDENNHLKEAVDPENNVYRYSHDALGRLTAYTSPMGKTVSYQYSAAGDLLRIEDAEGALVFDYNENGSRIGMTDRMGNKQRLEYNEMGQISLATDFMGNEYRFVYDAKGSLIRETDPLGGSVSYSYDAMGNNTSWTDKNGNTTRFVFDAANQLTEVIDAEGSSVSYTYDTMGRVKAVTDPLSHRTAYDYDSEGRVIRKTDALGNSICYTYDEVGNLLTKTDADGVVIKYFYDFESRLFRIESDAGMIQFFYDNLGRLHTIAERDGKVDGRVYDADGKILLYVDRESNQTRYEYNDAGRIRLEEMPNGSQIYYEYDKNGNCTKVTNAEGSITAYTYDANNRLIKVTDPLEQETVYGYDAVGQLISVTDARGGQTTFEYDGNGNLIREMNPMGGIKSYVYDSLNRLTECTDEEGYKRIYAYDAAGNMTSYVDANENQWTYAYDAVNRLTSITNQNGDSLLADYTKTGRIARVTDQEGAETNYRYDSLGRLIEIRDALGHSLSFTYDCLGRMLTQTDANGNTTEYEYSPNGHLLRIRDPEGNTAAYTYNALGQVLIATDASGNVTSYEYDALGQVISFTDAMGEKTLFTYTAKGQIDTVTDANGGVTQYRYDACGNLIQTTDPLGNVVVYEYDAMNNQIKECLSASGEQTYVTIYQYDKRGRMIREINPALEEKAYTYDGNGNIVTILDEEKNETTVRYDLNNKPVQMCYSDGKTANFRYNKRGELVEMKDWNGTVSMEHDVLGRLTKVTDVQGRITGYAYDGAGNRTGISYPDGSVVRYAYDGNNRRKAVTDPEGKITRYGYDAMGNILSIKQPGSTAAYAYNAKGLPTQVKYLLEDGTSMEQDFAYDALGRIVGSERTGNAAELTGSAAYTYDAVGRLLSCREGEDTESYTYDALGNRIARHVNGILQTSCQYNPLNQLIAMTENGIQYGYAYDKRGNLTEERKGSSLIRQYTYDATNHMVLGRNLESGETTEYGYNALYMRTKKVQTFIKDGVSGIKENSYVSDYMSRTNNDLMDYEKGGAITRTVYGRGYELLSQKSVKKQTTTMSNMEAAKAYFQSDLLGSPLFMANEQGDLKRYAERGVWGDLKRPVQGDANCAGFEDAFRFANYCYDPVIGKYFAQARFYDSAQGRMLAKDPIKRGLNAYPYCDNDPVDCVDPTGEILNVVLGAATGGGIGALYGFGSSAVSQLLSGEDFSLRKALGSAANGAVVAGTKGALISSGVGIPLAFGADFAAGTAGNMLEQYISNGNVNLKESIASGLTNAVGNAIYGNGPITSLKNAFTRGFGAGAATAGINNIFQSFGVQNTGQGNSTGAMNSVAETAGMIAPYMTGRDPRTLCGASSPFESSIGNRDAKGYRYRTIIFGEPGGGTEKNGFSLGSFIRDVAIGGVTGGLASASFYGAGKAVEALQGSIQRRREQRVLRNAGNDSTLPMDLQFFGSEGGSVSNYRIDMDNLNFSNTVQNHTGRPYQDSKLLINEIIESKPPVLDPRETNALSWTVEGTFNGSTGYYELIIDPTSNTVWHFVFKSQ